jgi:serine protease Do
MGDWATGSITQTIIISVATGSPAEKSGLKQGDLIVAIDGKAIAARDDLSTAVAAKKPGDTLSLDVQDVAGAKRTISVTLGDNPSKPGTAYLGVRYDSPRNWMGGRGGPGFGHSGMGLGPLTIAEVQANGPGAKAGLLVNDIITEVNGAAVTDLSMLMKTLASAKVGDTLKLKVTRGSETKSFDVVLGDNPSQKGKPYIGISVSPIPIIG